MGLAIAAEAVARGARVVLVLGPVGLEPPPGAEVVGVRSAAQMRTAVMKHAADADAVIMAAAVADYTVSRGPGAQKLAKDHETLTLTLTRTTDILAELGRWRGDRRQPVLVGFAAETHDVVARAQTKLETKRVDLIVANDVSRADAGFEVETNLATLVDAAGTTDLALQPKRELARVILDRVDGLMSRPSAAANVDDPA
jgi:phosphopantothenoylcysteine decarboxylase/phosphopantothenate--cysteine ligase